MMQFCCGESGGVFCAIYAPIYFQRPFRISHAGIYIHVSMHICIYVYVYMHIHMCGCLYVYILCMCIFVRRKVLDQNTLDEK